MKAFEVNIKINSHTNLKANLAVPYNPAALVIFSHGSGSSRFSTRNRYVAEILNNKGIATLLTDLLTEKEDRLFMNRFEINLLTERLVAVTDYTAQLAELYNLPTGYFGASTGAASALKAAAHLPDRIKAVVSRGGRPDLAAADLPKVKAPTLLVVGSLDEQVISLNKAAYSKLNCEKDLQIVTGAGHLFEEPGKLDEMADLAAGWFAKYLASNQTISKQK